MFIFSTFLLSILFLWILSVFDVATVWHFYFPGHYGKSRALIISYYQYFFRDESEAAS
jgi:hypothetical protein